MEKGRDHRVLLVDDDADVAELVVAILSDEDYLVSVLVHPSSDAIAAAVGMQEPDCVLLDGNSSLDYGTSWADAAFLAARRRSIPTIMFTAHAGDVREARAAESVRARAANFAAVLAKPFGLDELLAAVAEACKRSEPFNASAEGDRERTVAMARRLRDLGATDIRTSDRREWATFRPNEVDAIRQLYWWQRMGVYILGFYDQAGTLTRIGQFFELEAALAVAIPAEEPVEH